jgi:teichuronic acid biosynthesis glycosyltransferase TuaG
MKDALVSIVTPAYNSEATISETIESVRSQSYQDWELLVVVDSGTKDRTAQIVNDAADCDPRVRLIRIPKGQGLALSRNHAIDLAQGRYLAFLDSDDTWLPKKLEHQLNLLRSTGASFSAHAFRRMNFTGSKVGHLIPVPTVITYERLLTNNVIGCLTVLIDRHKAPKIHFHESKHEDYRLWLELLRTGHLCMGLNEDLARYRVVPRSRSSNKIEMARMRWQILRSSENLSRLKSCLFFGAYALSSFQKHWRF